MKGISICILTSIIVLFASIFNQRISAQVNSNASRTSNGCPGEWFTDCNIRVPETANVLLINHNIIWPNPSVTHFYLQTSEFSENNIQIRIINTNGQVIYSAYGSAYQTYRFGDKYLPGLYIVQISHNGKLSTIKAIKL